MPDPAWRYPPVFEPVGEIVSHRTAIACLSACAVAVGSFAPRPSAVTAGLARPAILAPAAVTSVPAPAWAAPSAPTDLRVENTITPLGLDIAAPRFSWKVTDTDRGDSQSAYQIRVAATAADLANGTTVWDSGVVSSSSMSQVAYAGTPLAEKTRYVWDVRSWDSHGLGSTTSSSWFEMGLLAQSDWTGTYIDTPFQYARKAFALADGKTVASARANIAAYVPHTTAKYPSSVRPYNTSGAYSMWINGTKVGNDLFEPNWTVTDQQVFYRTYDVTSLLSSGANVVGFTMSEPKVMLQLNITYTDGTTSSVVTDGSWRTHAAPVTFSDFMSRETYDARNEQPQWMSPTFDDSTWGADRTIASSVPRVSAATNPPIRVTQTITPTTIKALGGDKYMIDLGQNYAAIPHFTVSGSSGNKVTITYGEDWDDSTNTISRMTQQIDTFILRDGTETFDLQFSYRGFRYMVITGFAGMAAPTPASVQGLAVNTVLPDAITFSSSDPTYNALHDAARRTLQNNAHGYPEDCPHREKAGWGADANAASASMLYNFDSENFYTQWLTDIRLGQNPNGSILSVNGLYTGEATWLDPAWATVLPILTWNVYRTYGDLRVVQSNYTAIKRFVDYLTTIAPGKIVIPQQNWGNDWAALQWTNPRVFDTAYYFIDANLVASMADLLGNTDDAATYRTLAASIKASFNSAFYVAADHDYRYAGYRSQAGDAMALEAGLVPDDQHQAVVDSLVAFIAQGTTSTDSTVPSTLPGMLSGGVTGSQYIARALTDNGYGDIAGKYFQRTDSGSLGYMVAQGPGTIWEYPNVGASLSKDHPALAGQTSWLYESLAGIRQADGTAGFSSLVIDPHRQPGVTFVNTTKATPNGDVTSNWNTTTPGYTFVHEVGIPFNSTAVVRVSTSGLTHPVITEGGTTIWGNGTFTPVAGVTAATVKGDVVEFTVGAGHYVFGTAEAKPVRTLVEDTDSHWTTKGMTLYKPISWATGNSVTSGWQGSSASFQCESCRLLELISETGPARGIFRVRIDGGSWTSVDLYAAIPKYQQSVWTSPPLPDGPHTMDIEAIGKNPSSIAPVVEIDAAAVTALRY